MHGENPAENDVAARAYQLSIAVVVVCIERLDRCHETVYEEVDAESN